jgi:hypothetical protein
MSYPYNFEIPPSVSSIPHSLMLEVVASTMGSAFLSFVSDPWRTLKTDNSLIVVLGTLMMMTKISLASISFYNESSKNHASTSSISAYQENEEARDETEYGGRWTCSLWFRNARVGTIL